MTDTLDPKTRKRYLLNVGSTNALPVLSLLATLVTTPILLRSLGKNDFGIWVLLQSFLYWLELAKFGFNTTLVRDLAAIRDFPEKRDRVQAMVSSTFWSSLAVSFLLLVLTFAFVPLFKILFQIGPEKMSSTIGAFYLVFFVFVFNYPRASLDSLFYAFDRYYLRNLIGGGNTLLSAVLIVAVFLSKKGTILDLAGIVLFLAVLQFIATLVLARRYWGFVPSARGFDWDIVKKMFRPSLGYFAISLSAMAIFRSDNLVIAAFLPMETLAVYAVAYNLTDYAMRFIWNFSDLLSPSFSSCYYNNEMAKLRSMFGKTVLLTIALAALAALALFFFGPWFLKIWVGEDNVVPKPILNVFILTLFSYCITHACGVFINSIGKHEPVVWASGIEAVLNVTLSLIWVRVYGAIGVALGTLAAHLLTTGWFVPYWSWKQARSCLQKP
ncbi:MAG: oligosaccharide flippase family protein [Nitrospinae bacterium]|nr:oligosaccharide flippase family protein [Nitrospinota bacterium]